MSPTFECPYFVGAQYRLDFTPSARLSEPLQAPVQVTVLQVFEPFTISPVLKVKLESTDPAASSSNPSLPSTMILKLYDRRFAHDLREFHAAPPLSHESEALYRSFASHECSTRSLAEWESKRLDDDEKDLEPAPVETEAYMAALLLSYYDSEVHVYERLASLQGKAIPLFFGQTRFAVDPTHPETVDNSVPGILLEFVEGTQLSDLPASAFSDAFGAACVDIVNACGDAGVLNRDVRLENFLIPSSGDDTTKWPVVMIDFAQCRLRREDEDDMQWKREKWSTDEEGAIGYPLKLKFKWEYKPTWRYLVQADDDA